MIKRAKEIDPLSSVSSVNLSEIYQIKNDHQASIENCLKIIELDPNFPGAYDISGLSYLKQGRETEAIVSLEKAVKLTDRSNSLTGLGYGYGVVGKGAEAVAIIKELEKKYAAKEANGQNIAGVYIGSGDKDKAFEWLEKDFASKADLPTIRWRIPYESLRDDLRFKDLLKRMNLPE